MSSLDFLLQEGFRRILDKDVSAAVQICARISRLKSDPFSLSFFLALQENAKGESERAFINELSGRFEEKAIRKMYESGGERALQMRVMREELARAMNPENPERTVLFVGSNLVDEDIETTLLSIETSKPPAGMTPIDTAYFFDNTSAGISGLTLRLQALKQIKARMLTSCSNFLSQVESQVHAESGISSTLLQVQDAIYAFLRENTSDGLNQFSMAFESAKFSDKERLAASMTHLRRCLRTLADLVHPPLKDVESLSDEKYLNRMSKFIDDCRRLHGFVSPIDLQSLEKLLRNLNDRASKGVHDQVSFFEAQQVLIASILYIDNIRLAWNLARSK